MKVLVKNGICLYVFADNTPVTVAEDRTIVFDPKEQHIADCNKSNSILYENVTAPEDWYRYTFDGETWAINPNWFDPRNQE